MNIIAEKIEYLPATDNPLSADVYFIEGNKRCYIFDVGNNDNSLHHINQINREKTVILSHYHKDHIGNIEHINYHDLYVGKKTYETIGKGKIVEDAITINDGVKIEIIHCCYTAVRVRQLLELVFLFYLLLQFVFFPSFSFCYSLLEVC